MDSLKTMYLDLNKKLNLKEKEFNFLWDKLENIIERKIDPNDYRLLEVKKLFQKNYDEIKMICKQMAEIENNNNKY